MTQQSASKKHGRAVVIGGSMGGIAAARALSASFREVFVIERDKLSRDRPEHRPGTPQSWHIHTLIVRGQRELEALFPGVCNTMLELGAIPVDQAGELRQFDKHGWWPKYDSGLVALCATRALLEFAERKHFFESTDNAVVLDETRALDIITEPDGDKLRACGVLTSHPDYPRITADLVVDCSGRASRWKEWFAQRSVSLPRETVVDAFCGYSSRLYRPHDRSAHPWKAMTIEAAPDDQKRFAAILPVEDGQWLVTLGCFNGLYPPTDDAGFMEFARAIPTPLFAQALEQAEPVTKIRSSRRHEMRWNHFEEYDHPITHFVAVGDSAFCFNPHYAQGMTVALASARSLGLVIEQDADLATLPKRYYKRAKKFAGQQWGNTAQLDLLWSGTTGKRPWHLRLLRPVVNLLSGAAQHDPVVSRVILADGHAIASPLHAIRPDVLARIAAYGLKQLVS